VWLPEGATAPLPAVIVIHEWWGLNDHVRHWADRLAADGYAALAVDLYGGKVATTPDEAMAAMKSVDEAKAKAKSMLAAAHRFLADDPRIDAKRRGVIGWCFGGAWSLQHAIAEADLDAAVIYYGRLSTEPAQLAKIHRFSACSRTATRASRPRPSTRSKLRCAKPARRS